jgi:hypothetical protein
MDNENDDVFQAAAHWYGRYQQTVKSLAKRGSKRRKQQLAAKQKKTRPNQEERPQYSQCKWQKDWDHEDADKADTKRGKKFRRRFRGSKAFVQRLADICVERGWYCLEPRDVGGRKGVHLRLKILSALRVLGRAACFDDIEDHTEMSEETARTFFHSFCEKVATELFPVWCAPPDGDEVTRDVIAN